MLINDLIALLMQIPSDLAAGWGVWFFVGLILSVWQRKEKARLVVHGQSLRHKSGVRPSSGVRPPPGARAPKPPKTAPQVTGDAFGELEAMLEPAAPATHGRPGDRDTSPLLTEAPRSLAAPQSLP